MKRFLPIFIILIAMIGIYFSGAYKYLSLENLRDHHQFLNLFTEKHFLLVSLLFVLTYVLVAALSIPGSMFLSLLGGYLFPQPLSLIYVVCGATTGASLLFFAASTALKKHLRKKARPFLKKMEKGFQKNAANYLLFLRFVPLFPFWVVNLAPAFLNVRLQTFVWTTFVGIIPGSLALTLAGDGLQKIFDSNAPLSIDTIFNPEIKVALLLLGLVSLLPIMIKRYKKHD